MYNIGILGGTGEIGKRIVALCGEEYNVRASYHSRKPENIVSSVEYLPVDLNDSSQLRSFMQGCDIVINCAGSSFMTGEKAAIAAAETGAAYIDPFGAGFLAEKLAPYADKNKFVLMSGCFPGMTGIMAEYLCRGFSKVETINGINIDHQVPSLYGTVDFILSGIRGFGEASMFYSAGSKIRDNSETVFTDHSGNRVNAQYYYNTELDDIVRKYVPDRAAWYAPVLSGELIGIMQKAVFACLASGDDNAVIEHAKNIKQAVKSAGASGDCEIQITVDGTVNSQKFERKLTLFSPKGSSDISAAILFASAEAILSGEYGNGIYYAYQVADPDHAMELCRRSGMELFFAENAAVVGDDDYDEGFI